MKKFRFWSDITLKLSFCVLLCTSWSLSAQEIPSTAIPDAVQKKVQPGALWIAPTETLGKKLDIQSEEYRSLVASGQRIKGREGVIDAASFVSFDRLGIHQTISFPLFDDEICSGEIETKTTGHNGRVEIAGQLNNGTTGSFFFIQSKVGVAGRILVASQQIAYVIDFPENDRAWLLEKALSDVICLTPKGNSDVTLSSQSVLSYNVPKLSSRSGAKMVVYLDFDGETVTDSSWNNGKTIVARPLGLSTLQIKKIWRQVSDDFAPYSINITTDVHRYDMADQASRTRCIITDTDLAAPGLGGAAYLQSISEAGKSFSPTVPSWVFNHPAADLAQLISHEVGHSLGLHHNGPFGPLEGDYPGDTRDESDTSILKNLAVSPEPEKQSGASPMAVAPPVITSGTPLDGNVGVFYQYQITATNNPTSYGVFGTLPAGLSVNPLTGLISGIPGAATTANFTVTATNGGGIGTKAVKITIFAAPLDLGVALDLPQVDWSTSTSALLGGLWFPVASATAFDKIDYARSGFIGDNKKSVLKTTLRGPTVVSFRWKVDSELAFDFLRFKVDTVVKAAISGQQDWALVSYSLPAGDHTIEWSYEKDVSVSVGADAGFVDTVTAGTSQSRVALLSGSFNFGSVYVTSTVTRNLTIKNNGFSSLNVQGLTLPPGFSGNFVGTIEAGASKVVPIVFKPTAAVSYHGSIVVNCQITSGSNSIPVTGAGTNVRTSIMGLQGSLAFGAIVVGSIKAQTLTITNAGTATVHVSGISYPGGFSGNWSGAIEPGGSHNVAVLFAPTAPIAYTGSLVVNSDKTGGSNIRTVTGSGIAATRIITVTGVLGFGPVKVGLTADRTMTIKNTGNSNMVVTGITYPAGFSDTEKFPFTLTPGSSNVVTVTFAPTAKISYSGTATVNSNKTNGTNTLPISGSGI